MIQCSWCGKEFQTLTKVKIGTRGFVVCEKCLEAFKNHKCIECGSPITLNKFDHGRCLKCAQLYNSKLAREQLDRENEIETTDENLDDEVYTAWMEQRPIDRSKIGHVPE